jgi:serine-type D-Ala-D-Ala carboxypeptidase (penicillin-binding protein 5/6)
VVPKDQSADHMQLKIIYKDPLTVPVTKGDQVATLRVLKTEGESEQNLHEVPLYAGEAVEQGTLIQRAWDAAVEFVHNSGRTSE